MHHGNCNGNNNNNNNRRLDCRVARAAGPVAKGHSSNARAPDVVYLHHVFLLSTSTPPRSRCCWFFFFLFFFYVHLKKNALKHADGNAPVYDNYCYATPYYYAYYNRRIVFFFCFLKAALRLRPLPRCARPRDIVARTHGDGC